MTESVDEPIRLVSYDPEWPGRFELERLALVDAIGQWAPGGIHHVGSTAVEGLDAKPVIDVLVGVESLEVSRECFEPLAEIGYLYAPYRSDEMHWFCKPDPSRRTHHLHLIPEGSERFRDELAFRDHLRVSTKLAREYAELKHRLAARFENDRDAYTDAKGDFIRAVLRQGRRRGARLPVSPMSKLRANIAISLDGFAAGPNQSEEHPLGEGGEQLHEWALDLAAWREPHGREGGEVNASSEVVEEALDNVGASVMGRNMFGGGPGAWGEEPWEGWWGEEPPFHTPVFVLTHYEREPLEKIGTTFTFVTDGIESVFEQAREAAAGKDVVIGGGASVIQQALAAGLVDELQLNVVPVLLGGGTRLFEGLEGVDLELESVRVVEAPGVTHLKYRVASR